MADILHISKIAGFGYYDLSPKTSILDGIHQEWELMYIDSGSVNYVTDESAGVLKQGEILFHHPNEVHNTICNGKSGASMVTIIFECKSRAMKYFTHKALKVPKSLSPILQQLIDESIKTYIPAPDPLEIREGAPEGGEQLVRNLLECFLILLQREREIGSSINHEEDGEDNRPAAEIRRYLKDHLYERVTLEALSKKFHFGKSHMCVLFKRATGKTIIDYHLDLKVEEAKRLLREETMTVREVSERLGFESSEYFSRCFLQRTGYSPRSFRNLLITRKKPKLD